MDILPKGYCDGPSCSLPIIAAVVYNEGTRYVFSVQGDTNFNDIENKILSTFKFLPKECGSCLQLMPPHPDFCKNGKIIPGGVDECGCQQPPSCESTNP